MFQQKGVYNSNSTPKLISGANFATKDKSPQRQNEADNIYDQLWDTNGNYDQRNFKANDQRKDNKSNAFNKVKEEEIKKMRDQKLQKIRNENQVVTDRTPERRDVSPTLIRLPKNSGDYNKQQDVSRKFHNDRSMNSGKFGGSSTPTRSRVVTEGAEPQNVDIRKNQQPASSNMSNYGNLTPQYSSTTNDQEKYPQGD